MNGRERKSTNAQIWGVKTTRIMTTVRHVTSGSGLRKFQAAGFVGQCTYLTENIVRLH
jgi:hypothetical protein